MEALWSDIRYGVRVLLQRPGTTAVAILTLALGIGANTAIFSVVNGILLKPLPYESPDELVTVWQDHTRLDGPTTEWASPDNFFDWRDQNEVFDGMFALGGWGPTLSGQGDPEQLRGTVTSFNAFSVLGIEPFLGRGFRPEEDGAGSELVVLLGHALWTRRFGASREVLGSTITLDSEPATVIGVLPPALEFPIVSGHDVFAPLRIDMTNTCGRSCLTLRVIARLSDGVTLERARGDVEAIAARLASTYPDDNVSVGATIVPLHEFLVGPMRARLLFLLGAVGMVLLIACANVANLTLARAADREREVATRLAMGASRRRLFKQLLTENLMLAFVGSVLGLLLALWGVDILLGLLPENTARVGAIAVDMRVLAFTLGIAVLTGLLFGTFPAARATKPNLASSLKEGGRGSSGRTHGFRSALVISEVALALVLLVSAGLLMRSFAALMDVDPGFDGDRVLTAQLNLVGSRYDESPARVGFVERLLEGVSVLPGVEDAGVIYVLPMGGANSDASFLIEGREPPAPNQGPVAWYRPVSNGYFDAMKMRLARGRGFLATDDGEAAPVVVVNETAAARYWRNEDPLLASVRIGGEVRRVVGVVADTKHFGLDASDRPAMYFPYAQLPLRFMNLLVRASDAPESLVGPVRNVVFEIDPELAVANVTTLGDVIAKTVAPPRIVATVLGFFAAVAALLAAIGLYGVMSESVRQRTHEIGIRMALGASSNNVLGWAVGKGMLLLAIGATVGLVGAFFVTRFMESLLFGVERTDLLSFLAGPIVLTLTALAACYLPARRAAHVDPVIALRYE